MAATVAGLACMRDLRVYWRAIQDYRDQRYCVEGGTVTVGQLVIVFEQWANRNPQSLGLLAEFAANRAFHAAFPCN